MQDTIVAGVDGSPPSHAAVRAATSWAACARGPLLLVHAVPGSSGRADRRAAVAAEELLERERAIALATLPGLEVETAVVVGDPMWALARAATGARAVVVGSHKTGFLRGTAFGSSPLQLVAAATSPVVVVPATVDEAAVGVVVGLDDSPDGVAALDAGIRHARARGDDLLIVRATGGHPRQRGDGGDRHEGDPVARSASARDTDMMERARERAERLHPGLVVRSRLVAGPPAPTLLRLSSRAALLVVGRSRAEAGEAPIAVGRATHDVLLNLAAPTVVVSAEHSPSA